MLTLLRKLGILRSGAKRYQYASGRDLPAEALMDDVLDAEKDLVGKTDLDKVKQCLQRDKNQGC